MATTITIDTDPGIDDALALVFASRASLPVRALTTVYGNADSSKVTLNAGYIVKNLGTPWEIYQGADKPLQGTGYLAESHGASGLGNITPSRGAVKLPSQQTAIEYLRSELEGLDTNVLLCLGPLTNVALALQADRLLLQRFRQIIIMGGVFSGQGNVTDFAEFNCYNDPEAAAQVYETILDQGIDATLIPAEICRQVLLTPRDATALQAADLLPNIKSIVAPFIDYYLHDSVHGGYDGAVLYDVLVPLYYTDPALFQTKSGRVDVELADKARRGQTTFTPDTASTLKLCTGINRLRAKSRIMQVLTNVT